MSYTYNKKRRQIWPPLIARYLSGRGNSSLRIVYIMEKEIDAETNICFSNL